ncbi:MAG: hypothetical protein ACLUD1_01190 [Clostridia bacterium]
MKLNLERLKDKKGFTGIDVVVAVLIILLFVGMLVTAFYNIYKISTEIAFEAEALQYLVSALEYSDKINYEEVTEQNLLDYLANEEIPENYTVTFRIQSYNQIDSTKQDIVKIVTGKIVYQIENKEEFIEISKLKVKE